MMKEVLNAYLPRLAALPGEVCFFGKDLTTGEQCAFQADIPVAAASVIKIPILIEAFRQVRAGKARMDEIFSIRPEQKMPSCGALTYLHDGLEVTLRDLCVLMIILSDNSATNILIDRLGIDSVNACMRMLGLRYTALNRKLYDQEAQKRGVQNRITAREMGLLLEMMSLGQCIGRSQDAEMLAILADQRLNGKIPFFIHGEDVKIAHKTGEDDGITHDVGILYARHPLVLCFASEHTDVPAFERLMQDATRDFYRDCMER